MSRFSWLGFCFCALLAVPAAAETMYETKSGCETYGAHMPSADLNVVDGKGVHGNSVAPANLGEKHPIHKQLEYIDIPVEMPVSNYVDTSKYNADLSDTRVRPGTITVDTTTNTTRFNGVHLSDTPLYNPDCVREKGSIYTTK